MHAYSRLSLFLLLLPLAEPRIVTRSALPPLNSGHRQKLTTLSVVVDAPLHASETHSLANLSAYLEDNSDGTDQGFTRAADDEESGDINSLHQSVHENQGVHMERLLHNVYVAIFCKIEVKISHYIPQFWVGRRIIGTCFFFIGFFKVITN